MNYSGGPNILSCEQCILSSCLTPQYACLLLCGICVTYLMVLPMTVTTYWYDNYGLACVATVTRFDAIVMVCGLTYLGNISLNNSNYLCHSGGNIIDSTSAYCSIY